MVPGLTGSDTVQGERNSAELQMVDSRVVIVLGQVKHKWTLKACWEVTTQFFVFKTKVQYLKIKILAALSLLLFVVCKTLSSVPPPSTNA